MLYIVHTTTGNWYHTHSDETVFTHVFYIIKTHERNKNRYEEEDIKAFWNMKIKIKVTPVIKYDYIIFIVEL
jgi:hypothetical protein